MDIHIYPEIGGDVGNNSIDEHARCWASPSLAAHAWSAVSMEAALCFVPLTDG